MLLICTGEDSYRSLEKARELESAFRTKYDSSGASISRLTSGKPGVEALLQEATGGSLFSTRRFFRVDGLLSSCPAARVDALVRTLERDVDSTIIVCVEEGALSAKALKAFSGVPKLINYEHETLSPAAFLKWASAFAAKHEVTDQRAVASIAQLTNGDSWAFVNEFMKWKAGGELSVGQSGEPSVYDVIDTFLARTTTRWSALRAFDNAGSVLASIVSQVRAMLVVKSGAASGMHPYVAQKLSRMRVADPEDRFMKLTSAFVWSRTGMADADESLDVLG